MTLTEHDGRCWITGRASGVARGATVTFRTDEGSITFDYPLDATAPECPSEAALTGGSVVSGVFRWDLTLPIYTVTLTSRQCAATIHGVRLRVRPWSRSDRRAEGRRNRLRERQEARKRRRRHHGS